MATFWEIAARSVDHVFSLCFDYFVVLIISRFGFKDWVWVLIASVPDLCILFYFSDKTMRMYEVISFSWSACFVTM